MIKPRHSLVPAVFVILRREDKILLLRRFQTGWRDGEYTVPAGHLDGKESIRVAAARETKEEVGVEVNPEDLELVTVINHPSDDEPGIERVDFFFEVDKFEGEPTNTEPHKCDHLDWFDINDLPQVVPTLEHGLNAIKSNQSYEEFDF